MRRVVGILVLIVMVESLMAQQVQMPVQYTLANGMRVLLDPVASSDKVFGGLVVNVGAKHESYDATGLAHYQEHMLFKGTESLGTANWEAEKPHIDKIFELYDQLAQATDKKQIDSLQRAINEESVAASQYVIVNEFDKLVKQAGGQGMNAATSWDATVYFNAFPASEMEKWMSLYSHRFEHPVFRGFQAELEVVYEEQNAGVDNIGSRALDQFMAAFYPTHPYGSRPLIGKLEHLKRPSLTQMKSFFDTYYVPNNMMLVLSGNFEVEQAKKLIEKYFGGWKSKPLPEYKVVKEAPFKGRKAVTIRSLPIRAGVLAFRLGELSRKDEAVEAVLRSLLTNKAETGKLDSLSLHGKLMAALALRLPFVDESGFLLAFVPKIVGQRFRTAERYVWWALDDLRTGRFTDDALKIAKLSNLTAWERGMEEPAQRFTAWSEMYISGKSVEDVLNYKELLNSVTREDVVALANRVFGADYLLMRNKIGFAGGTKIAKPDYKPVIASAEGRSKYAQEFDKLPSHRSPWTPLKQGIDYQKQELPQGNRLYAVKNKVNDIFTLQLRYAQLPADYPRQMGYLSAMENATPDTMKLESFKEALGLLGATLSLDAEFHSFNIKIQGLESHYDETLALLRRFLVGAHLNVRERNTFVSNLRAEKKIQRKSVDSQVAAIEEYARRGKESFYLQQPTAKELKRRDVKAYDSLFQSVIHTPCEVYYVGEQSAQKVAEDMQRLLPELGDYKTRVVEKENWQPADDAEIIFLPNKKATQAKISIAQRVDDYTTRETPERTLLNSYLSDGFSGILLQEIREFRSLAYTTYGYLNAPSNLQSSTFFFGKLETQGDKAIEALELYLKLIDSLPQYPDRLAEHKENIMNSLAQQVPTFRALPSYVSWCDRMGFTEDPRQVIADGLMGITWEKFYSYYQRQFGIGKRIITIVGDPRTVNLKELKRKYKVREVKLSDLIRY